MRLHRPYLGVASGLFLVELCIALFVHDQFVRPYLGDVLVVPLVHFAVAALFAVEPRRLGVAVLFFAFGVEVAQYHHLVESLGLQDVELARVVIGTSYATGDLFAYLVGAIVATWSHLALERRPRRRSDSNAAAWRQ